MNVFAILVCVLCLLLKSGYSQIPTNADSIISGQLSKNAVAHSHPITRKTGKIYIPGTIDSIFKGQAFWGYSISRVGTSHDSLHFYSIQLDITRYDSAEKIKPFEKLRAPGAIVFCRFRENGIVRKIPFYWQDEQWFADFAIHSDQPLSIEIVTIYRNKKKVMRTILNKGTYPGEDD